MEAGFSGLRLAPGRALSFAEVQNLRVFGNNERKDTFSTPAGREQAFAKTFRIVLGLEMDLESGCLLSPGITWVKPIAQLLASAIGIAFF